MKKIFSLILLSIITLSITILTFLSPHNSTQINQSTETRGVWLTNVGSGVLFSPWGINRAIEQLASLNFNTIYPVVWNRATTFYPSQISKEVTGRQQEPLLNITHPYTDILAVMVKQGHRSGFQVIPWFEYGLMAPANSSLAKLHPEWLTEKINSSKTLSGEQLKDSVDNLRQYLHSQQVWLNPFHPEVREFLTQLIVEVVSNYNVDGIQLDDHFSLPVELGYDPYTTQLYQEEHSGQSPPQDPRNREWMRWRADKITALLSQIVQAVQAVKPDCLISLSPNSASFAYQHYLQDWPSWVQQGLVQELVLQVYRQDINSFQQELSQSPLQTAQEQIPVSIGILSGTWRKPVSSQQIQQQVEEVRDRAFNGVAFFYWESLWSYITPESPQQRRRFFRSLFD